MRRGKPNHCLAKADEVVHEEGLLFSLKREQYDVNLRKEGINVNEKGRIE